jgi:hypothetical protein
MMQFDSIRLLRKRAFSALQRLPLFVRLAAADETETVVLDFIGPARAGRNRAAHHWQTRLNEAGRTGWHATTILGASTECESAAL